MPHTTLASPDDSWQQPDERGPSIVHQHAIRHGIAHRYRPGFATDEEATRVYLAAPWAVRHCCVCGAAEHVVHAVSVARKRDLRPEDCRPACASCWERFLAVVWPCTRGMFGNMAEAFHHYEHAGAPYVEQLRLSGPMSVRTRQRKRVADEQTQLFDPDDFGLY